MTDRTPGADRALTLQEQAWLEAGMQLGRARARTRCTPGSIQIVLELADDMFCDLLAMDEDGRPEHVTDRNAAALLSVAQAAAAYLDLSLEPALEALNVEAGETDAATLPR